MKRGVLVKSARRWHRLGMALAAARLAAGPLGAAPDVGPPPPELIASPEAGWPQFRGPRRDGISDERGLLQTWPEGGPRRLWSATGIGRGFSSPTIVGGRIFITGEFGEELRIMAFDLDGQLLWRTRNGSAWLNQYPGARAAVTVVAGELYHENAHGRVACLEAATGRERWAVDLLARFRGENITWGLSECLLVDERAVYAAAGGRDALLVALDRRTGEVRWRSEPVFDTEGDGSVENAGYASPILVRFAGRRLLIGCSLRHVYCADAETGKIQWTRRRPTSYSVQAMMPVLARDGVFVTAPFGPPGRLYRLVAPAREGDAVGVAEGWSSELDTCQGGAVCVDGRIFGAYYPRPKGWAAVNAATGELAYETSEIAKGAVLYADRRLYALSVDGWMQLVRPTENRFEVVGRFQLAAARDRDAWAHPVVFDGRLYLRFHDTLSCYDVHAAR